MEEELDRARVEAIAKLMMEAIVANFQRGPHSRDRVFEALNACAYAVATVIAGTGDGRRAARKFFLNAMAQNESDLASNPPRTLDS